MAKKLNMIKYTNESKIPQIVCRGCGAKLTYVKKYEGLPCNSYCCGRCCPSRKQSPCPKERKFGEDVCNDLFALQNGQ